MSDTSKVETIMHMTGCDQAEAEAALLLYPTDLIAAMDFVLPQTTVTGSKYIPSKPVIDTGMDEEQKTRCERGRWMQDKVNAVFSVAHSKTLPAPEAEQSESQSAEVPVPVAEPESSAESLQDSLAQTIPLIRQSEYPL